MSVCRRDVRRCSRDGPSLHTSAMHAAAEHGGPPWREETVMGLPDPQTPSYHRRKEHDDGLYCSPPRVPAHFLAVAAICVRHCQAAYYSMAVLAVLRSRWDRALDSVGDLVPVSPAARNGAHAPGVSSINAKSGDCTLIIKHDDYVDSTTQALRPIADSWKGWVVAKRCCNRLTISGNISHFP
jgi:hypothetical protein